MFRYNAECAMVCAQHAKPGMAVGLTTANELGSVQTNIEPANYYA